MQRPNVDEDLTLLTKVGKTEAIVIDVLDNPATEEGVLLKVMQSIIFHSSALNIRAAATTSSITTRL